MRSAAAMSVLASAIALSGCVCGGASAATSKKAPMTKTKSHFGCPGALLATREGGLDPDRYVVPTDAERDALRDAIATLLSTDSAAAPQATIKGAALLSRARFEMVSIEGTHVVLVREAPGVRRGGGAYLLRPGSRSKIAVEAPHTFFDEGTLPLACDLFERTQAFALFIDTAHRYKAAPKTETGESPADVAHARNSLFQAATQGLLRARPRSLVVQLHGFAEREGGAAIVLSGGEKTVGVPIVSRAHAALAAVVAGAVLRFPEDTSELGATTNVQGVIVREAGGQFLHVEIAAPLRRDLVSNAALRDAVMSALARALEGA